jgi:hypothetical protein
VRPRYVVPPPRDLPPPASQFFQLAIRTGISIPAGSSSAAASMGDAFSFQVPFLLELGVKVHPMIFLGAYGGPSIGGTSSPFGNAQGCTSGSSRSCIATDWRVGLEVQVHFRPAARFNPWVGYGLGFEAASASASGGGAPPASQTFTGLELARLAGGLDIRFSRYFGLGPFVGVDFGSYSQLHAEQGGQTSDQSISSTALHEWITLGVRGVLFP